MKRKTPVIAIALLAGAVILGFMILHREGTSSESGNAGQARAASSHGKAETSGTGFSMKTKATDRDPELARATHQPHRLREFMLPEVVIDGMPLEEALGKLYSAYQDACFRSGETPLALSFVVPSGGGKKLKLKLTRNNFNSSVHLLAALSGMKANRNGTEYRFERIANEHKAAKQSLDVPPDLSSRLQELAGIDPENRVPLSGILATLGLDLDPATKVSLKASGRVEIESADTADASAIAALLRTMSEQRPTQHKFTSHLLELSPEFQGALPDLAVMTGSERQLFLRNMAQKIGVTLSTFPSGTARSGQDMTIEIGGELIAEKEGTPGVFETHDTGHLLKIHGDSLGFGHDLAVHYTHTTGELDPQTRRPVIDRRTDISDAGFSGDQNTRISVQTRSDGSKTLFLITAEMIDATGMPIRPKD